MTYKTCPICGYDFFQDQPWKTVCYKCWKSQRPASNLVKIDADELQEMRRYIHSLEQQTKSLHAEINNLRGSGPFCFQAPPPSDFKDRLHDLIFLCHPDKHAGSHKATEVTAWLLDVRREVAA